MLNVRPDLLIKCCSFLRTVYVKGNSWKRTSSVCFGFLAKLRTKARNTFYLTAWAKDSLTSPRRAQVRGWIIVGRKRSIACSEWIQRTQSQNKYQFLGEAFCPDPSRAIRAVINENTKGTLRCNFVELNKNHWNFWPQECFRKETRTSQFSMRGEKEKSNIWIKAEIDV